MKTILITGARARNGLDAAVALAKRGHRVFATVHREESVAGVEKIAKSLGLQNLKSFKLDICLPEDRARVADLEVDVLINNAAIGESGSLAEVPFDAIRRTMETNVFGTLGMARTVLPKMVSRGSGRVIFINSLLGRNVIPFWGAYNMSKFSLVAATEVLRQEFALLRISGLHFISVEPGAYHTGFNQRVVATKYKWMSGKSYFAKLLFLLRETERIVFGILEEKTTTSVVNDILKAVDADRPLARYSAPRWQDLGLRFVSILSSLRGAS
jgi:short-subunit dehydrogenase